MSSLVGRVASLEELFAARFRVAGWARTSARRLRGDGARLDAALLSGKLYLLAGCSADYFFAAKNRQGQGTVSLKAMASSEVS